MAGKRILFLQAVQPLQQIARRLAHQTVRRGGRVIWEGVLGDGGGGDGGGGGPAGGEIIWLMMMLMWSL